MSGKPEFPLREAAWAAITLRPGQTASEKDMLAFCRQRLASYKVPRGIDIREELPKNALGKVISRMLREEVVSRRDVPVEA